MAKKWVLERTLGLKVVKVFAAMVSAVSFSVFVAASIVFGQGSGETDDFLLKARTQYEANEFQAARDTLFNALNEGESSPELYLALSRVLEKTSEPSLAIELLEQATREYSGNPVLLGELGYLYSLKERFDEAIVTHQKAYDLSGGAEYLKRLAEAYHAKSYSEYRAQRFFESLVSAQKAVKLQPDSAAFNHLLGMCYFSLRQNRDARQALEKAIELDPEQPAYYYDLALVNLQVERFEDGEKYLKKTLELEPDFALPYLLLGRIYHNQSKTETALEYFENARRLDPSLKSLHYHIGYAHKAMGKNDLAVQEMEREVDLYPDHFPSRLELGEILLKERNPEAAVRHLEVARELQPRNPVVRYQLGKALFEQDQIEKALSELKMASEIDPEMSEPYYLLAQIYIKQGKREEAQQALEIFKKVKKPM